MKFSFRAEEPDLFEPPTGPEAEEFTHEDGMPERYVAWRETEEGERCLRWMAHSAYQLINDGAKRVSVNYLSDLVRVELKIRHCNTWRPWMATDVVKRWPDLLPYIQRKKRKSPEPDPVV